MNIVGMSSAVMSSRRFLVQYLEAVQSGKLKRASQRRTMLRERFEKLKGFEGQFFDTLNIEMIRRWLDQEFDAPPAVHSEQHGAHNYSRQGTIDPFINSLRHDSKGYDADTDRTVDGFATPYAYRVVFNEILCKSDPLPERHVESTQLVNSPEPTEPAMSKESTPIKISTMTLINDVNAENYSNAQLYELIAEEERRIKDLEHIENKPNRLQAEIDNRKAGIHALVAHLNARDEKSAAR